MDLVVVGLSHKTASLDQREAFAVPRDDLPGLLGDLIGSASIAEAFVLSTCNRVEIYAVPTVGHDDAAIVMARILGTERGLDPRVLEDQGYAMHGQSALHHLLRVTASLDSLVVGEPQILGQVKEAVQAARRAEAVGPVLGRFTDRAFSTAKRARHETGLARAVVSIGSVAAELAGRIFDDLAHSRVLLVGAGKMAEATARALAASGAERVYVANRSAPRARDLADRYGWNSRAFSELEELLTLVDVVITSTGASRPIIDTAMAERAILARKYRPLFLVDIAVPRNVAPRVADLDTIYLYNIDDLEAVSQANLAERLEEAEAAEALVAESLHELADWLQGLESKPTVAAIRRRAETITRDELDRTLKKRLAHLGDDDRQALVKMTEAMVGKLLHPAMEQLRNHGGSDRSALTAAARILFGVDTSETGEPADVAESSADEEESA